LPRPENAAPSECRRNWAGHPRGRTALRFVRDLFYDRACIGELAAIVTHLVQRHGAVDAARYRDELGLGRKRTIQILEFFDRVGYTRRVRDSHVLRGDSGWRL
jgi:selenocysteine-specific elongation factor